MKTAKNLVGTIANAIDLVFGSGSAHELSSRSDIKIASPATLSRATYKLDFMHMLLRLKQWHTTFEQKLPVCVSLCSLKHFENKWF